MARAAQSRPPSGSECARPRILVDDNPPLRYALGRTLRQHGFEVIDASTGEALHLSDSEQPDLVLLDVNVPDIHGTAATCRRRAPPPAAAPPSR
jgi:CheY-like chemotaxis protein